MHKIKDFIEVYKTFVLETLGFFESLCRHNASSHTYKNKEKMQYVLLRQNHTIEKGMSLRNPRKGFGKQKVEVLLHDLEKYFALWGQTDSSFMQYPLSTIGCWIDYTKRSGEDIAKLEQKYHQLVKRCKAEPQGTDCTFTLLSAAIQDKAKGNYKDLMFSRHSIRYFEPQRVSHEELDKALTIAQQTPSACNRQGWKTYIYESEDAHRLVQWQGGARGFEDEIQTAILVTANLRAFLFYEPYQAYVDGGLYAMNLINALHSIGLGTIPLSCGFKRRKLCQMHDEFHIPENEAPIMIIGTGYLPETVRVATSSRKPIEQTNTYCRL